MATIYLMERGLGWLSFEGYSWGSDSFWKVGVDTVFMFWFFILVAAQEELLFRGYILQNVAEGLNILWGFLLSSLIFALMHFSNPGYSAMALLGIFLSGLFIAYSYICTRQLWLPAGIHLGWNFFEGTVFGFQVSGLEGMPRLIKQTVSGPTLFTGGSFGPEAGLILIPALILGLFLIRGYSQIRSKA